MQTYDVTLKFIEPLLGTIPLNKELYEEWVQTQAADGEADDELETVEEMTEKGTTGFHRLEDGTPVLYDYVIKGFFKDACGMLRRVPKSHSSKEKAYKKVVDGLIFVKPRRIPILKNGEIGILERPLRAKTAQGERIALSRSESMPVGSSITFQLHVMDGIREELLREWLDYGALRGLGQWRNGGYGSFTYEMELR